MKGMWRYLKAAFNARPLGMFVAPNWIGLAAFGLLGILNWGFWVIGAGVELAYLLGLAQNARFRAFVDGVDEASRAAAQRVEKLLARLDARGRARHQQLVERCQKILDEVPVDSAGTSVQHDALQRLVWLHLNLLHTEVGLHTLVQEAAARNETEEHLRRRIESLEKKRIAADPELARSLEAKLDILRQRAERQGEARQKLAQVDAEIDRVEHQVELLREEAVLSTEPATMARRIDVVSEGLNETMRWVRIQDGLDAEMEQMAEEIPELLEPPKRRMTR
jgi:hypothetical protein